MKFLLEMFPQSEFGLLAVVLGMPLLGAFVNGIWGKRLGKDAVRMMALTAMGISFLAAVATFFCLDHAVGLLGHPAADAHAAGAHAATGHEASPQNEYVKLTWTAWEWLYTTGRGDAPVPIAARFSVDALSGIMMLVITGVGFLIHLYASSYMETDKGYWRFFAYLNLFVFSMLILVLGDNLPLLFVGWEGVGLCSYLLIGFWYDKTPNAAAGKKAFIANRIGDFGLICAMILLVYYTGTLDWDGISSGATKLLTTNASEQIHIWPVGGNELHSMFKFMQPAKPFTITPATAVCLCLLLGATGKSAQLPLYVWLPDAMAGPTPVSALIHAATMVTAGIYLVCRLSFVFVMAPGVMMTIAIVGALTALLAATIALVQNDIKKVLAYSTVSQLGFMFLGVGMGAFTAGFFHVLTHAFFKACMFLGAGSVIHSMHARLHNDDDAQDMRNMGGLRKYMPQTFLTFAVATAAIVGFPLTSGFFSKDEILFRAFTTRLVLNKEMAATAANANYYVPPTWIGQALYVVGLLAATMTAFYMCRLLFLTFFGDFRGWTIGKAAKAAAHANSGDHHDDHHDDRTTPGPAPHESPWQMTVPLIVLGTLAAIAGFLNAGLLKHSLHFPQFLEHWLEPVFRKAESFGTVTAIEHAEAKELLCTFGAFSAFAIGSGLAYWVYIVKKGQPAKQWAEAAPGLHKALYNKWYVDEIYDYLFLQGVDALAEVAESTDRNLIDMVFAKLTAFFTAAFGTLLRAAQTGVVHVYAAIMVLGLGGIGYFVVVPHPEAQVVDLGEGNFEVRAAPGIGYGYVWRDSLATPLAEPMKPTLELNHKVHLNVGEEKTIELRVRNAFGMVRAREFKLSLPKPNNETALIDLEGASGNAARGTGKTP
jgi:NADH-quinone oxidoreductase subunit L